VVWLLHDRDARSYRGSGGWALHIQVLFLYWAALWSRLPGHSVCLVAMPLIPCHWLLGMTITADVLQWYGDASAVWYSMHNNPFGTELAKLVGMFPRLCYALNQVVVYYELLGPLLLLTPAPRWSPALQVLLIDACKGILHFTYSEGNSCTWQRLRLLVVALFLGMQAGFGSCLRLELFPWVTYRSTLVICVLHVTCRVCSPLLRRCRCAA